MKDIVAFEGQELEQFLSYLKAVTEMEGLIYSIRVAVDEGGVKFKINEGVWTRPFGRLIRH